jgi:hypothetical protein
MWFLFVVIAIVKLDRHQRKSIADSIITASFKMVCHEMFNRIGATIPVDSLCRVFL